MQLKKLPLAAIVLAVAASSLTGCVVTPARAYVAAPAPVVVVHSYYRT